MSTTTPVTSRDELVARVEAGWRPFRQAVRGIGRERIGEKTSAGWTYRDLIAHVAAWEDLTARRLRGFADNGTLPKPPPDIDAFNAKVVESHRLVGAEAVLDELDAAHRGLVRELSTLSDEQVLANVIDVPGYGKRSWAEAVVAGNTYGHYEEHAEELAAATVGRQDIVERGLDGW